MTSVNLGMPAAPPPVLAPRRKTRQIKVGKVLVGGDAPVSVQSMTTTLTSDVNTTLQQIAELTASGCDIVRVACPSQDDADALPQIAQHSQIPVIADIHFQPKYVFAAIDAGCAAVRVNPGNIRKFDDQVKQIAQAAKDRGTSIRIGVNAGSLDQRLLEKYGKATPRRSSSPRSGRRPCSRSTTSTTSRSRSSTTTRSSWCRPTRCSPSAATGRCTSASPRPARRSRARSSRRSPSARCSRKGIGDTIRVSLSAPPVEEVKVGLQILESLNLRPRQLEIVSCPSCGRAQVDVYKLADEVTAGLEGMEVPLRVAVMGCVVNGPGEAREADLGVASGNGKGQIFVKGEVIKTVPESKIVETLIEEAMRIAEEMGEPVDGELRQRHRHRRPTRAARLPRLPATTRHGDAMTEDPGQTLLRDRDFQRYAAARGLSLVGSIITLVALPVLVYRLTGSASMTALVAGLEAAPYAVFGLFAGALSDRWNRRTVMVVADVCSALLLATVPLAHLFGVLTVPHVLAVAFLGPTVGTFFDGAVFGAVPMLVGRSRIAQANAYVWSLQGMVEVVMPAAVGVALAVLHPATLLLVDALSVLVSAALISGITRPLHDSSRERPPLTPRQVLLDIREGLSYLWQHAGVRTMTVVGFTQCVGGGGFVALMVVWIDRQLGLGTEGLRFGLVYGAWAVGGLLASVTLPRLLRRVRRRPGSPWSRCRSPRCSACSRRCGRCGGPGRSPCWSGARRTPWSR